MSTYLQIKDPTIRQAFLELVSAIKKIEAPESTTTSVSTTSIEKTLQALINNAYDYEKLKEDLLKGVSLVLDGITQFDESFNSAIAIGDISINEDSSIAFGSKGIVITKNGIAAYDETWQDENSLPSFAIGTDGKAIFRGKLEAPDGVFGVITAGLLKNSNNTNFLNIGGKNGEIFLKIGETTFSDSEINLNTNQINFTDGTNFDAPFSIDLTSGKTVFNGKLTFTNTDMSAYDNSNLDWQTEVQNALDNDSTTIDGGKIVTGSISANKINTNGLVAENISADTIVGKTIDGGIINGARINGAVIKASYLDLDGELEVLTNYHISVATYNANPSLYTDAIYIEADNEYRIPSISSLLFNGREVKVEQNSSASISSGIYSYATGNVGHNIKVVKQMPTLINFKANSNVAFPTIDNCLYANIFIPTSSSTTFKFYIGNLLIISVTQNGTSVSYGGLVGSGTVPSPPVNNINHKTVSYGSFSITITRAKFQYGNNMYVTYGGDTSLAILHAWNSGDIRVEATNTTAHSCYIDLPSIEIDNMI